MDYRTPHAETIALGAEPRASVGKNPAYLRFRLPFAVVSIAALLVVTNALKFWYGADFGHLLFLGLLIPVTILTELAIRLLWRKRHPVAAAAPTTARRIGAGVEIEAPVGTTVVPLEAVRRTIVAARGLRGPAPALAFGDVGVVACKILLPDDWPAAPEVPAARWKVDEVTFRALESAFLAEEPASRERIEVPGEIVGEPAGEVDDGVEVEVPEARRMR